MAAVQSVKNPNRICLPKINLWYKEFQECFCLLLFMWIVSYSFIFLRHSHTLAHEERMGNGGKRIIIILRNLESASLAYWNTHFTVRVCQCSVPTYSLPPLVNGMGSQVLQSWHRSVLQITTWSLTAHCFSESSKDIFALLSAYKCVLKSNLKTFNCAP